MATPIETTRAQLEETVHEMDAFADACEGKSRLSNDDNARLDAYSEKVRSLVGKIKRLNGEHLTTNPSLSESLAAFHAMSGPATDPITKWALSDNNKAADPGAGLGTVSQRRGSKADLADFNFSPDQLKELQTSAVNRQVNGKAAITSTLAPMANVPDYRTEVFPWLRDRQRILDLVPKDTTEAPTVHYFRALAAATAAGAVAQGADKPESSPTWEEVTATVRKLAHFTRVNDEVIADFRAFLDVVGSEMIAGLIDEENDQLLNGTGVGQNLTGLTVAAGVQTVGSAGTDLDAIAAAFLLLRTGAAHCDPDVVIMHPADWYSAGFALAKETTGAYLLGSPVTAIKPMLWGVPVVITERQTENTAVVANLKVAATAYIRQPPTLEVHPFGGGTAEFIANQTLIRAEERLTLAVHHPAAIVLVTAV